MYTSSGDYKLKRSPRISKKTALKIREHLASQGPTIDIGGLVVENPMHKPYHQSISALDRWQREQTPFEKVLIALHIRKGIPYA